jgi:tRNA(fMet)-specific endonuclease VapC
MTSSPSFDAYLANLDSATELYTSVVVAGEVRFGLARLAEGARRRRLGAAFESVLRSLNGVLETTRAIASEYGDIKAALWKAGTPIGENDIWIAATGRAQGLTLVTSDIDFDQIPELSVHDWERG